VLSVLKKLFSILTVIYFTFNTNKLYAQRWEIGGLLGGTNYIGDLAKDPNLSQTGVGINLWGRYNLNRHFAYRFGVGFGKIQGDDAQYKSNQLRGLSFRSNVWELTNIMEFNFEPFGLTHPKNKRSTFYVFSGINLFAFNPQAQYNGKWVDLQPLGTEGQYLDGGKGGYSKISVAIPMGGGIKYKLTPNWIFGFEIGYRKTYTDYLDDVSGLYPDLSELYKKNGAAAVALSDPSTISSSSGEGRSAKNDMRGDSHLKDWYIFSGITITYRFANRSCYYTGKHRKYQLVD
jgi:hypothetical protein